MHEEDKAAILADMEALCKKHLVLWVQLKMWG